MIITSVHHEWPIHYGLVWSDDDDIFTNNVKI